MPSKTRFNKLQSSDITLLNRDRLLGILELNTDRGRIDVVIHKLVAEHLMEALIDFLQAGEGKDAPRFDLERSGKH